MGDALTRNPAGLVKFTAGTSYASGQVLRLASGLAAIVMGLAAVASGDEVAAATEGQFDVAAASATTFDDGQELWWDDTNNLAVAAGNANATFRLGVAVGAKTNGQTTVLCDLNAVPGLSLKHVATAASAAVTNIATETVVGTFTIPAGALKVGSVIEFLAAFIATATNATDTFRGRVRLGGLAGTVVADTTAIDLANNDVGVLRGEITIRTLGAPGSAVAAAQSICKTTANPTLAAATPDTTAALTLVVTIEESVANAGNSARLDVFNARVK